MTVELQGPVTATLPPSEADAVRCDVGFHCGSETTVGMRRPEGSFASDEVTQELQLASRADAMIETCVDQVLACWQGVELELLRRQDTSDEDVQRVCVATPLLRGEEVLNDVNVIGLDANDMKGPSPLHL